MQHVLFSAYVEPGYKPIPKIFLTDEEYSRGLSAFAYGCTNTVVINTERKTIYLAKRRQRPMAGWWWIGGRMNAGEKREESVVRCFTRETKLALPQSRFTLRVITDYLWKDRAQEPQDVGCHPVDYIHTVELSPEELNIVSGNLDPKEYDAGGGLHEFDRQRLVAENVCPSILELYDYIFPPVAPVESSAFVLPGPKADDHRRTILEANFNDCSVQLFHVKEDSILGNHFHENKTETFVFLEGGGTVRTAEVNSAGNVVGKTHVFKIERGTVVRIPPFQTHRFNVQAGTRFICYSSAPFNPEDMYPCHLPDED